uniref:Uncharacterized protein n=1 Tax=Oryza meridionalis TaxID=40149 RepID=A0A0E0BWQ8_9ORYZ
MAWHHACQRGKGPTRQPLFSPSSLPPVAAHLPLARAVVGHQPALAHSPAGPARPSPSTASTTTTPPAPIRRSSPTHAAVAGEFAEAMPSSPKVFSSATNSYRAKLRRLLSTPAFSAACLLFGLAGFLADALSISWSPGSAPRARCPDSSRLLSVSIAWDCVGPVADDGAGLREVGGNRR